jgi:hypothetical protein
MFGRIKDASKSALRRMSSLHTSGDVDPDVRIYNTLAESDFSKIMGEYGEEETLRYIREMERKRLQRR